MDFKHDMNMVLPPREDWDQRGMLVVLCLVIFIVNNMFICMDVDAIFFFVFAYVGP